MRRGAVDRGAKAIRADRTAERAGIVNGGGLLDDRRNLGPASNPRRHFRRRTTTGGRTVRRLVTS
jgi:hypothetical protein